MTGDWTYMWRTIKKLFTPKKTTLNAQFSIVSNPDTRTTRILATFSAPRWFTPTTDYYCAKHDMTIVFRPLTSELLDRKIIVCFGEHAERTAATVGEAKDYVRRARGAFREYNDIGHERIAPDLI